MGSTELQAWCRPSLVLSLPGPCLTFLIVKRKQGGAEWGEREEERREGEEEKRTMKKERGWEGMREEREEEKG
jgi:hypothetical protein